VCVEITKSESAIGSLFGSETIFHVGVVTEGFVGGTPAAAEPFVCALINQFTVIIQNREIAGDMQRAVGCGFDVQLAAV